MEFIDLKTQQQRIKPLLDERMQTVLAHGRYIMGPEVAELETTLAKFISAKYCIGVASGTDALLVALMALGIGPGDEVITTPFSFIATIETIALLGAKPVFVDIDKDSYNLDPKLLAQAITDKTKAIMPVSLYGQCADFAAINAIASAQQIAVIEDGAQSFGATYQGRYSCNLSTIGCTSFFPSKPLGCYGDGGACFTNDAALAERMQQIRVHGQKKRYYHTELGANARLDTLQAAILLAKFSIFPEEITRRQQLGQQLSEALKPAKVTLPKIAQGASSVYGQFTIATNQREALTAHLNEQGIPTAVHYPTALHLQPVFSYLNHQRGDFPVAEQAADQVLSLPFHPYLTDAQIEKIASTVITATQSSNAIAAS